MADETLAFNILARDHASSAFDKVARSADRTAASLKKSAAINDAVAKAEARLSKARDGESDALGRVRVAETRLAEIRGNSNAKTSQIQQAEEALSSARRKAAQASNTAKLAEDSLGKARAKLTTSSETVGRESGTSFGKGFGDGVDKEGSKSGKRFSSSLRRWLTGSGGIGEAGKVGGTVFGSGFLGVLKTPILGPAVASIITAAVATTMPAVGAIAAAGLVAGFGGGLAVLGSVFAAKSVAVRNNWNRTLSAMAADMKVISVPFEKTLSTMATVFRRTFTNLTPDLAAAFKLIGPALTEFGDDLGRAVEKIGPVIRPLSEAFTSVLKSLGPAMQTAIGQTAQGLAKLAESVKQNPEALADTVKGLGNLTSELLATIATLNKMNAQISDLTGGASGVDLVFGLLSGSTFGLRAVLDGSSKAMELLGAKADKTANSVEISAETTKLWTQGLSAAQVAAAGTGAALDPLPAKVESLAVKFERQWAATQKANDALTRMSGLLLTLSGSEIAFQAAIDDASASIKENGKTHDINTAKGRANKTALDQVAASANAQTIAMRNAGDGNVKAAKSAEGARANFVRLAQQMGYTKPQAEAMAKSMIAIPNVTRTAKLNANKKDLETKLAAAKRQLADKDLTKERRAQLNATIAKLEAGIRRAKDLLAGVPASKTVTITTRMVTERIIRQQTTAITGGHASGFASGGLIPGRPSNVDNHIRPMATGEFVVQADKVRGNLATLNAINEGKRPAPYVQGRSGGSSNVQVTLRVESGGARLDDFIAEMIRRYVRVNGGDVQAVFGR